MSVETTYEGPRESADIRGPLLIRFRSSDTSSSVGGVGDNASMGNLWVATRQDGWIRADQIIYIGVREVRNPPGERGQADVIVRLSSGSASSSIERVGPGGGEGELATYSLARSETFAEANSVAGRVLSTLIAHADHRGVARVADGKVIVRTVEPWDDEGAGTSE